MWGDEFGMFTDQFGISWMVNISGNRTPADSAPRRLSPRGASVDRVAETSRSGLAGRRRTAQDGRQVALWDGGAITAPGVLPRTAARTPGMRRTLGDGSRSTARRAVGAVQPAGLRAVRLPRPDQSRPCDSPLGCARPLSVADDVAAVADSLGVERYRRAWHVDRWPVRRRLRGAVSGARHRRGRAGEPGERAGAGSAVPPRRPRVRRSSSSSVDLANSSRSMMPSN